MSTRFGVLRRKIHETATILIVPRMNPMHGLSTMNSSVPPQPLLQPCQTITPNPLLAMAAPASAPSSACDELVGSASNQVMMFQMTAPMSPAKTTYTSITATLTMPVPICLATVVPNTKAATKLKKRRPHDRLRRGQHARRNHRRDRVGRIVKSVEKVEDQSNEDDSDDQGQHEIKSEFETKNAEWNLVLRSEFIVLRWKFSSVLQHDALDGVGHVFAAVDGVFDVVVEFFPFHHVHRVVVPAEKI